MFVCACRGIFQEPTTHQTSVSEVASFPITCRQQNSYYRTHSIKTSTSRYIYETFGKRSIPVPSGLYFRMATSQMKSTNCLLLHVTWFFNEGVREYIEFPKFLVESSPTVYLRSSLIMFRDDCWISTHKSPYIFCIDGLSTCIQIPTVKQ